MVNAKVLNPTIFFILFLKVSDADFTLHASYAIAFFWEDRRVFVDDPQPYYILDTHLLVKFWTVKTK